MELGQLRHFLKIAEHGSFTRAAEDCGLSQPAMSQQVARLEQELGRPVFDRLGRQVRLTEAGELLRRRAEQILALIDDTAREIRDDGRTGRVVVAAIPTVGPYLLPGVLRVFAREHPGARVEFHEEVTEALLKHCLSGEIDVGVLAMPVEAPGLRIEPLFEEELLLVLPTGHRLAGPESRPICLEDVRAEPFVLLDEAHCLSARIRGFCLRRDFQPVTTGRTGQLTTVQELVALGHGVSFIPLMARRLDTSDQRVYRAVTPRPTRTLAVCWNPHRYQPGLVARFLEALRDQTRSLATTSEDLPGGPSSGG
ncbi:LysR family transcriptional regulator [soil metagenome]